MKVGGGKLESLQYIPNDLLIESYNKAVENKLSLDFIEILKEEMKARGLSRVVS